MGTGARSVAGAIARCPVLKTKMFRPGSLRSRRSEKIATRERRFGRSRTHIPSFVFYLRRNARARPNASLDARSGACSNKRAVLS